MQSFTVIQLQKMMLAFCEHIITHKDQINSINVFPVPDQDTGSNLASTFEEVKKSLQSTTFPDMNSLAKNIEQTSLFAAQGNSGIIFTGFLAGFFAPLKAKEIVSGPDLVLAFHFGAEKARNSIEHPTRGTILDVIDAAAAAVKSAEHEEVDQIMYKSFVAARTALEETTNEMKILKESKVVDAGGLAFVILIESFYTSLTGKKLSVKEENKTAHLAKAVASITHNRYEVVFILQDSLMTSNEIKDMLSPLGDSIDIVDISNNIKVHIHTDKPETVKELASSLGTVLFMQLADMKEEKIIEVIKT